MSGIGKSAVARLLVLAIAAGLPLVAPAGAVAGAGDIATYAGGVGEGTATQLRQVPEYVAVSGSHVYVSDSTLAVVRVIDTTTGRESLVAGTGYGFAGNGGPATQAKLSHPTGLALDSKGDLFISDTYNNQVREVNPSGTITTVAGTALGGYSGDGGPATSAQLLMPVGLAVDARDNLFIADSQNNRIREVDMTTGIIHTYEGTGLFSPTDVAFDPAGDLLIMDSANGRVARVTTQGGIATTIAGGGNTVCSPCPALSTNLFDAEGIAVDQAGNLLIANTQYNVIQKVDKLDGTGTVTNVAGNGQSNFGGDGGQATAAKLYHPMAVKVNPAGGFVIADQGNERVRNVDALGTITTIAGTGGCGYAGDGGPAIQAQLCGPRGMALDATGALLIADGEASRIRKVDAGGTITTVAGNGALAYTGDGGPATQAGLNLPMGLALDSAGNLFIADTYNDVVREVTLDGVIHTYAGDHVRGYSGDGVLATQTGLNTPTGLAFDGSGNLLIADQGNNRIRRVDHTSNTITTIAGTGVRGASGDGGNATLAQLNLPTGIAVTAAGYMFIADSGNNEVRVVNPSGIISRVAGSIGAYQLGDGGPALDASLFTPTAVAVGPQNILYIADEGGERIRMVTPDGIIHTAAGNGQLDAPGFSGDGGAATAAALNAPFGLLLDSAGNIFIGDTGNRRVRRVEAYGVPGSPMNVVATGANGGATVTWTAPPTGGMPIIAYTVTPYHGATAGNPTTINGTPPPTSVTVTGLVRGQTYTFVVRATNILGTGPPSLPSNAVTVYLAPSAPGAVQAVAGINSALVSWTTPADDGGTPILSYVVTPFNSSTALAPSTVTGSPVPTAVVIPGLSNGTFYTFTVAATNQVGTGAPAASNAVRPIGGGSYHPLPPARILDTRIGLGSVRAPLANGESRSINVGGRGPVPAAGVSAIVLNVTITNPSGTGHLTVYPTGVPRPTASNLNWTAHQTIPNLVEIALGQGGQVDIYAYGSSVDVIFDVQGWVGIPANSGADGLFHGLTPARILDTRDGTGGPNHPLGAGATLNLQVTGSLSNTNGASGVPASGVSAVVLNVTITNPTVASYLTVYPAGSPRPATSNLNFIPGQTVANRVIVKLGTGGAITIYNLAGNVNVIADVNGWFTDATNPAGGTDFSGIRPTRILDTRTPSWGLGPLQGNYEYEIQLLDNNGAPLTGISAVVVNVTATDTTVAGYLTLWPNGVTVPDASDLNFLPGQTVPNLVVLQLGDAATFRIYNSAGNTDAVIDLVGFYGTQDAAFPSGAMRAYSVAPPSRVAPAR